MGGAFKGVVLAFIFLGSTAQAYCIEPSFWMSTPVPPSVPYCVDTWSRTHTCDDWVIDDYNRAIQYYNDEVERFVRELNNYVDDAFEYAQCRMNELE